MSTLKYPHPNLNLEMGARQVQENFDALEKKINGNLDDTNLNAGSFIPIGGVIPYAGSAAPTGWLQCDGSAVSRTTYTSLFDVLSTTFGVGDGSTTFNVPDLRGRTVVGVDGAAGRLSANDSLGNSSGAETHTLTTPEIPAHTHGPPSGLDNYVGGQAGGGILQGATIGLGTGTPTGSTGGGGTHNNMPPYQVVNYLIRAI